MAVYPQERGGDWLKALTTNRMDKETLRAGLAIYCGEKKRRESGGATLHSV